MALPVWLFLILILALMGVALFALYLLWKEVR